MGGPASVQMKLAAGPAQVCMTWWPMTARYRRRGRWGAQLCWSPGSGRIHWWQGPELGAMHGWDLPVAEQPQHSQVLDWPSHDPAHWLVATAAVLSHSGVRGCLRSSAHVAHAQWAVALEGMGRGAWDVGGGPGPRVPMNLNLPL